MDRRALVYPVCLGCGADNPSQLLSLQDLFLYEQACQFLQQWLLRSEQFPHLAMRPLQNVFYLLVNFCGLFFAVILFRRPWRIEE